MSDVSEAVLIAARAIADHNGWSRHELSIPDALAAVLALEAAGYDIKADA